MEVIFRIPSRCGEYATRLDYEDWKHFRQWSWKIKRSKRSNKVYFHRALRVKSDDPRHANNSKPGWKAISIYLHVAVLERKGTVRPRGKDVVDHENGDSLDCRRSNLRWSNHLENMANRPVANQHHDYNFEGCSDRP